MAHGKYHEVALPTTVENVMYTIINRAAKRSKSVFVFSVKGITNAHMPHSGIHNEHQKRLMNAVPSAHQFLGNEPALP